jgi:hypothetical protein
MWILAGLGAWGALLLLLIWGMLKAAKDQDRQMDETNSHYDRMNEDTNG